MNTPMPLRFLSVVCFALCLAPSLPEASSTDALKLVISVKSPDVHETHQWIQLTVSLVNLGSTSCHYVTGVCDISTVGVMVTNDQGKICRRTSVGEAEGGRSSGSMRSVDVEAHGSSKISLPIDRLFDLSPDGRYTVACAMLCYRDNWKEDKRIKSNEVTILSDSSGLQVVR